MVLHKSIALIKIDIASGWCALVRLSDCWKTFPIEINISVKKKNKDKRIQIINTEKITNEDNNKTIKIRTEINNYPGSFLPLRPVRFSSIALALASLMRAVTKVDFPTWVSPNTEITLDRHILVVSSVRSLSQFSIFNINLKLSSKRANCVCYFCEISLGCILCCGALWCVVSCCVVVRCVALRCCVLCCVALFRVVLYRVGCVLVLLSRQYLWMDLVRKNGRSAQRRNDGQKGGLYLG